MVARVTALGGDQARGALGLVLEQQPLELSSAKPQPLRRQPDRQHPVDHGLHRLDPIDLAHAHRDRRRSCCHRHTSAPGARAADSATSLLGQNATLLIGSYTAGNAKVDYVNRGADPLQDPLRTVVARSTPAKSAVPALRSADRAGLQRMQVCQSVLGSALVHELLGGLGSEGGQGLVAEPR